MTIPRFYPILDTRLLRTQGIDPFSAAEVMLSAGARILQFRHKEVFDRAAFELAERIGALCQASGAVYVINDRVDFALLLGAAVHLGQLDLPPVDARRIMGAQTGIGFSTHNELQVRAAAHEPVDYLAFGPIFPTTSKDNPDPVTGIVELGRVRQWTKKPLVAIGGIGRTTAAEVLAAGADAVAVVGDLCPAGGSVRDIALACEAWLRAVQGG